MQNLTVVWCPRCYCIIVVIVIVIITKLALELLTNPQNELQKKLPVPAVSKNNSSSHPLYEQCVYDSFPLLKSVEVNSAEQRLKEFQHKSFLEALFAQRVAEENSSLAFESFWQTIEDNKWRHVFKIADHHLDDKAKDCSSELWLINNRGSL